MDSRDSSSTSSMVVTRDGGSAAEDDGALSAAAKLGKESAVLFQSGKYAECVDVLKQLLQKKEADLKVLHNIALAEFFRDGCLEPRKLLQALVNIKKRYEDLSSAPEEQLGTNLLPVNRTATGPKSNSMGHQVSEANMVYSDESDASLTTLNMATVLYHLHDYSRAMSLLESLFQNIEPLDEVTALHVCLLMLDLAVYTLDAAKFADVINYIEKAFGLGNVTNQADNGSMGQHQSSNLVSKSSSVPCNVTTTEDMNSDSSANASETSLSRTLSDETIDYDNIFSSLDIASGGVKYQKQPRLPVSDGGDRSSFVDLKLKLPLYKVQHLLLLRNLKAAKRELKLAMNIVRGRDSSIALLLKSQLEMGRGNDMKAEKLLKASHSQQESGNSIIYDNNMGCIFFQWGKFHAASAFFHKALLTCCSYRKENPRNLTAFSRDKTVLILYNSGLQYLACGQPILAGQCLQKASLVFYKRPLLWIRLAECCLMALKKGVVESFEVAVIGQGKWRHLAVMSTSNSRNDGSLRSREKVRLTLESDKALDLSMSYARDCLLNALGLLRRLEEKQVKYGSSLKSCQEENKSGDGAVSLKNVNHRNSNGGADTKVGSKDNVGFSQVNANGDMKVQKGGSNASLAEYEDICRRQWCMMKQAVLADLAFIELELGNPVAALKWAHALLQISESSKIHSFLAHVYAAESLCLLNRASEAAEQLSVYLSGGIVEVVPYTKEDCEQWHSQWQVNKPMDSEELNIGSRSGSGPPKGRGGADEWQDTVFRKPEEAQGALYLNLAAMYSMQGEFGRARQYSEKALSLVPNSKEAHLMGVYLDIKQGNVEEARSRLRRCNRVTFVSQEDLRLKGSSSSSSS